jgi:hypothetical protein
MTVTVTVMVTVTVVVAVVAVVATNGWSNGWPNDWTVTRILFGPSGSLNGRLGLGLDKKEGGAFDT